MVGKEKNIFLDRKSGNFNGYDDVAAYFFSFSQLDIL